MIVWWNQRPTTPKILYDISNFERVFQDFKQHFQISQIRFQLVFLVTGLTVAHVTSHDNSIQKIMEKLTDFQDFKLLEGFKI